LLKVKDKVIDFLNKYGMYHGSIDIEENCRMFIDEMEKGLRGSESSLKMIPTYISMRKEIPIDEPIIVIDAGGTNFRAAVVYFNREEKAIVEEYRLYPMPGTKGEITKEEFFKTIAEYIGPVLKKSNRISFCFSYPTDILPNGDGRLIQFCKEVKVKGVEGELIGENLNHAIKHGGYSGQKKIVLLNDTSATLLGGKASYPDKIFSSYIGFILGTGTNTCYIEENRNILKVDEIAHSEGAMLVNMESGSYGKIQRGIIDLAFDSGTATPDDHVFEKMISGGYQGGLILAVIKQAACDGLFSVEFSRNVSGVYGLTSKEIDDFLYYPYADNTLARCCSETSENGQNDQTVLYFLIDAMLERAAKLVAINLSSVITKTEKGDNPCMPVCITAEGTTFYKSKLLKSKIEYYMKTYLNDQKGKYCEFVRVDNATLIGTAIAGLQN